MVMSKVSELFRHFKKTFFRNPSTGTWGNFPIMQGPHEPEIYSINKPDYGRLQFPENQSSRQGQLLSGFATKEHMESLAFRFWAAQLHESWRLHRKLWEFCYILQGLYERDLLQPGKRGLGFAVGEEPLPSLMASYGCKVVATDLDVSDPRAAPWAKTNQLTNSLEMLNKRGICAPAIFREHVSYRPVDMNNIPADLRDFDFTWSSCSFEHCGSIEQGHHFLMEQVKCLKPGGIGIHTTEFNLTSNDDTITTGPTVIFRRNDIEDMISELRSLGHRVEPLCLDLGGHKEDKYIDTMPYGHNIHMKLKLFDKYTSTSIGLIIERDGLHLQKHKQSCA